MDVIAGDFEHERARPDRDGALLMAGKLFPECNHQQLEELLWTYTRFPFGDLPLWTTQLTARKEADRTVFTPP